MNKFFCIFFVLILSCSLNPNSSFWSKSKNIKNEKSVTRFLFEDTKPSENEFNPKLKVNLPNRNIKNIKYNFNNDGFTKKKFLKKKFQNIIFLK